MDTTSILDLVIPEITYGQQISHSNKPYVVIGSLSDGMHQWPAVDGELTAQQIAQVLGAAYCSLAAGIPLDTVAILGLKSKLDRQEELVPPPCVIDADMLSVLSDKLENNTLRLLGRLCALQKRQSDATGCALRAQLDSLSVAQVGMLTNKDPMQTASMLNTLPPTQREALQAELSDVGIYQSARGLNRMDAGA